MAKGLREDYNLFIGAPVDLNILKESEIEKVIQDHIEKELLGCCEQFIKKHDVSPTKIRLTGNDLYSLKQHLREVTGHYLSDDEVRLWGFDAKITSGCSTKRGFVVLEYWDTDCDED